MGLSVWRETSKKLTVYRVCYTPIETLLFGSHIGCYYQLKKALPHVYTTESWCEKIKFIYIYMADAQERTPTDAIVVQ